VNPSIESGLARRLARVQAVSGLVFFVFAVLHLTNTVAAAFGPSVYNGFQRVVRPLYQSLGGELLLVAVPLFVHMAAGIARMRMRKGPTAKANLRTRLHRYAGWFLLVFILGHVAATRGPSLLLGIYPEFEGVSYSFVIAPYWFYPYYVVLGLAGVYHALSGLSLGVGTLGVKVPPRLRQGWGFWAPIGAASTLVLVGVLGLAGVLFETPDATQHPFSLLGRELLDKLQD